MIREDRLYKISLAETGLDSQTAQYDFRQFRFF